MTDELKPCPFCGGIRDEESMKGPDAWAYFVRCRACAAQGPWVKNEAGAKPYLVTITARYALTAENEAAAKREGIAELHHSLNCRGLDGHVYELDITVVEDEPI